MLADDCAPAHAESLTQSLSYARGYADEITRMLAAGNVDSDSAAQLVQAINGMLLSAIDDLYALDDVQQEIDARESIHKMADEELFLAITSEH
ncbi:hypothetical protein [Streptomyces globisporus]|uniref:hypothetical protein n=1 Tax=Streptomyces globisporus TaxID=1908 RepID=UPI00340E080F